MPIIKKIILLLAFLPGCTIAQELRHGAFNLHHTFTEPNFTLTESSTNNLMDYPAGNKLYKYQWDKMRYPDIVVGMMESDEEARLLLIDFGFLTCGKRALEKASKETGLPMKLLAATIEGALCATEEDKCDDEDYWAKYSYGLANGIIQQLDVFAIRDVAIDLLKSQLKNKLSCLLNGEEVTINVTSDLATQNQLRSIFKCQFGIDTSPEEIQSLWGKAKAYIEKNYESPYLRGQATALVLTIVLPPLTKAIQAGKITQLVNKFKNIKGFTTEAANLDRLATATSNDVVNVLDDLAKGGANRFFKSIDEFKAAIARGDNVFYVGKHADITPRPTGVQSHHGVNSVWMENNYSNYVPDNAPSVYMLNDPNHNATRGVFNTWRAEMSALQGTSKVDYSKITKADILKLAERQFDAADVPKIVRDEYYKLWEDYLDTMTKK